ncbi:MAG: hypothetical protein Q8Q32_00805 [bacterium]|nr:hypothetical protein [bacterium]
MLHSSPGVITLQFAGERLGKRERTVRIFNVILGAMAIYGFIGFAIGKIADLSSGQSVIAGGLVAVFMTAIYSLLFFCKRRDKVDQEANVRTSGQGR